MHFRNLEEGLVELSMYSMRFGRAKSLFYSCLALMGYRDPIFVHVSVLVHMTAVILVDKQLI